MIGKPPILFHLLGLKDEATELSPLGLLAASTAALCATCVYLIIRILKDRQMKDGMCTYSWEMHDKCNIHYTDTLHVMCRFITCLPRDLPCIYASSCTSKFSSLQFDGALTNAMASHRLPSVGPMS